MLERRTIEDLVGLLKTTMGECRLLHSNEKEHVQTIFDLEKERSDLRRKLETLEQQCTEARDARNTALVQVERLEKEMEDVTKDRDTWQTQAQEAAAHHSSAEAALYQARNDLQTKQTAIRDLEARLREDNPDYARADVERKALQATVAEAHAVLDTTGTPGEDAQGDCIPLVERLEDVARVFKEAKEQLGYSEAAVPDPVGRGERP